jgi:hypothetical protein
VEDPRISRRSRALVVGRPDLAGCDLGWLVALRREIFFFLVGLLCCCCSFFSFVRLLGGWPALPGRMARPRRWNPILVPFQLVGA